MGLKLDVYANSYSDQFYISDVIDGIYYAKVKNGNTEYRKAKYKRRTSDGQVVYCIEPFVGMAEYYDYTGYDYNYEKLLNLSTDVWERISLLSYYGYGYKDHTDSKWYPITQILIWETIDKDATFYWTDTYKGSKITKFTEEIAELESLVKNHNKKPSFDNTSHDMSISSSLTLTDKNGVLSNYELVNNSSTNVKISDNDLIVQSDKNREDLTIELVKKDKQYKSLPIVYVSEYFQNVLSIGSYPSVESKVKIHIDSGQIKIVKLDYDNNDIESQGDAELIGAVYEIFDEDNALVGEIVIGEDNTGTLNNLKYGTYKIKEKKSGLGYQIDPQEYQVTINNLEKNIEISLTNKVIKRKIKLHKFFVIDSDKRQVEKGITFQIIDSKNNVYKEVKTDEFGSIELDLPFGTYTVRQVDTTEGYAKVDDFDIIINENTPDVLEYYLDDLLVPNTLECDHTNMFKTILIIGLFLTLGIYFKYERKNS